MAGAMILLLALAARGAARPVLEEKHIKGFKGDALSTTLRLRSRRTGWVSIHASSLLSGAGESRATVHDGTIKAPFVSNYAGRFTGMRLRLEFSDPLQLFTKVNEVIYEDFTLDAFPLSLLKPASARRSGMLTLGEVPAGSPGMGQEIFSIDEYQPFSDTKNIIWKRVARSADQNLFVRIRESNVPGVIRVGLLDAAQRADERIAWMDLLCEGVGLLGKELIDLGCAVEILYEPSNGLAVQQVSNLQELADALMKFSGSTPKAQFTAQLTDQSDVVVTGLREAAKPEIARTLSRKPSLLIYERASPAVLGELSVIFSGRESVFPLVARVVEK